MPTVNVVIEQKQYQAFLRQMKSAAKKSPSFAYSAIKAGSEFIRRQIMLSIRAKLNKSKRITKKGVAFGGTGRLRTDWSTDIDVRANLIRAMIGTRVKHARTHEYGIREQKPKIAGALTIPIGDKVYPPARDLWNAGDTFVKEGIIYLKQRGLTGKGSIIPIYTLRKSVSIPARPYVKPVVEKWNPELEKLMMDVYQGTFK